MSPFSHRSLVHCARHASHVVGMLAVATATLGAQDPVPAAVAPQPAITACYDPTVGALYLIKLPGLSEKCLKPSHVELVLRQGGDGVTPFATGPAGGDLSGAYPNPVVIALQTKPINATAPVQGQALFFTGGNWKAVTPAFNGDVTGGINTLKVEKLQNLAVSATAPTAGQVLQWDANALAWTPSTAPSGVTVHGQLSGLTADDHPQYLLSNAARGTTNGFAVTGSIATGTIPASGPGVRMLWFPAKAAFRAGGVAATEWDAGNIGDYSTAFGYQTTASGVQSLAAGQGSNAVGPRSTALGFNTLASGDGATALGGNTVASGNSSTAMSGGVANGPWSTGMGLSAVANGAASLAMGESAQSNGYASLAGGVLSHADGVASLAFGDHTVASGNNSLTFGANATASGIGALAFGAGTTASGSGSMALGENTTAGNEYAVAVGFNTAALAEGSITTGANTAAHGINSIAVGNGSATSVTGVASLAGGTGSNANGAASLAFGAITLASGTNAVATGNLTQATGNNSTAMGQASIASGTQSTAIGNTNTASGSFNALAMGVNSTASGFNGAVAIGYGVTASGAPSTALGNGTLASGANSTAIGVNTIASGFGSTAMGQSTTASGTNSTAIGYYASANGKSGVFVFGDKSTSTPLLAAADNQFVARAAGGTTFYSNSALTLGVTLAANGGAWASVSDRNRKQDFRFEDGELALSKIAQMPITSWSYKSTDGSVRHLGPMAQDFRAAFGLGADSVTITTTDIDGVNLLAVQALEKRTAEQRSEIAALRAQNSELMQRLARLEALLDKR